MQHGGEMLLQIDPFAKAIGGHQHPFFGFSHLTYHFFSSFVSHFGGDHLHVHCFGQCIVEQTTDVVCCGNVFTENDGMEIIVEPFFHHVDRGEGFGIVLQSTEFFSQTMQTGNAVFLLSLQLQPIHKFLPKGIIHSFNVIKQGGFQGWHVDFIR